MLKVYSLIASQLGVDLRVMLRFFLGLPRYVRDYVRFRAGYKGRLAFMPCLHDWYEEGGDTKSEYFWQDLLVSRMLFAAKPDKHVDIGSRVDGFVSHVASFREIEVLDIRPITAKIPGVIFRQADLMSRLADMSGYCDSLSCLHALEHFGLGRYCDSVDPNGFARGLSNMAFLLKPGGTFYLSVPIGIERVEFNAHRVFSPTGVINLSAENGLRLLSLTVIQNGVPAFTGYPADSLLCDLGKQQYSLGVFVFNKS